MKEKLSCMIVSGDRNLKQIVVVGELPHNCFVDNFMVSDVI